MKIKKQSVKMTKLNSEYSKLRKLFLSDKPMCEARIFNCTLQSTEVHHKKGRLKYHLDTNTWLSVCRNCHNWIENSPEEAKELGFSEIRT
jgi:hypothetical protein